MHKLFILLMFLLPVPAFAACQRSFYIDYTTGSNAAAGTKVAPWKVHPFMVGWDGTYSHAAGDCFYFKGGETWPNSVFPMTVISSGNSTDGDYYGADVTWHTGGSFTRPKFDAGGAVIAGTYNDFVRMSGGGGSYTTWDNIEWTNYTWTGNGYGQNSFICAGACSGEITNVTITNNYFHKWNHGSATSDALYILLGNTNSPYMSGSVISNNVFDNTDGDMVSGAVLYAWSGTITNNTIRNVTNALLLMGSGGEVGNNDVGPVKVSFDASSHENCIETLGGPTPTWYIHDNLCHHGETGESMMIGNTGETDYVWNNVIWNWAGNSPHFAQNSGQSITRLSFWNNIIVPVAGGDCFIEVFSPSIGRLDIQNNHCITTGALTSSLSGITSQTIDHNLLQSPATATAQGYTFSQSPYVYFPTAGGSTITAGADLSASCSGSLVGLCSDTTYAGARTVVSRGSSWDAGAYQYGGSPTAYTLTVTKFGTGSGTVSGGSINCGSTCSQSGISSGTTISMSQSATSGSTFAGWGGTCGCTGTGSCAPTITADCSVTATFVPTRTQIVHGAVVAGSIR
jgi:hypothetical protein